MRRNQRVTLHYRNWHRSLYVEMRQNERKLARHRERLAWEREHAPRCVSSCGRVIAGIMRHIDQSWRFLGLLPPPAKPV